MQLDRVIAIRNTKTIYRDGRYCIKVFNNVHSKYEVLNEALNIALIEKLGIQVPKLIEVKIHEGKWAIVSEYIKGKSLAQIMKESPSETDRWLRLFVDLQIKVFSYRCPSLYPMKEKLLQRISFSRLDDFVKSNMQKQLHQMSFPEEVCHGDFNPSNIIITGDNIPYLIDWAHVIKGNSLADAAWSWLNFSFRDSEENAEKYLDLFCAKREIPTHAVMEWIPFVAASKSVKRVENEQNFLLKKAEKYWLSKSGS